MKRANSAAARAGTTKSASVVESAWAIGAEMIPIPPATTAASTVFTIDSWFTERPASIPEISFSEAARVARPKRVQRYSAASTSVSTITIPAIQKRFTGTETSATLTVSVGKRFGICLDAVPNPSTIAACSVSRIPSDATSFASGAAVRSGRNTSTSISTPTRAEASRVTTIAGAVPSVKPKKSDLSDHIEYAATIATAPVARLMIPDPR